jgi:hypothetical protein
MMNMPAVNDPTMMVHWSVSVQAETPEAETISKQFQASSSRGLLKFQ